MKKICLEHFPEHLTRQPFWLVANDKKIPTRPSSEVLITGDRLSQCLPFASVEELVRRGIHPFAVYLHNQKEPCLTLDLDKARDPKTGQPLPWVCPLFEAIGIPASVFIEPGDPQDPANPALEVSWSGTGYHLVMSGKTHCDFGKRCWLINGKEASGKADPKAEVIVANNLITPTGFRVPGAGQRALPVQPLLDYLKVACPDQHQPCPVIDCTTHIESNKIITPSWRGTNHKALTAEQVADMLDKINPDCGHDQWKQIGMAINSWDSTATGKALWTQWSQGGSQYGASTQKEINAAWKSFKPGGAITIASVVKLAQDAGYQFPRTVPNGSQFQGNSPVKKTPTSPPKIDQTTTGVKADQKKNNKVESPPALAVVPINPQAELSNAISDGIAAVVSRYNKVFVHSRISTKNRVLTLEMDDEHQQLNWVAMPFVDFREMLIHEPLIVISEEEDSKGRKKPKMMNPAQVWLTSKDANFVPCSTFYPVVSDASEWPPLHEGKLNLYRGFNREPIPCNKDDQDVKRWLYHIKTVVCKGDDLAYQYLMNWFAHMIQKPEEKPQTAIILKGEQGTGKNLALRAFLEITGVHGLYIERPGAVSGKHNKVLDNRVLVFADEAAFHNASDCRILRGLISEKSHTVEPKGIDCYSQRNFIRLVMATNSNHSIRFANDERRYVVLEMSNQHKQDHDYFGQLVDAYDRNLSAKLLFLFQTRDIRDFLPMDIPQTKYLTEGKINNLEPEQAFVYEALMHGSFQFNGGWAYRLDTATLQRWFQEWLDKRRIRFQGDINSKLGKVIKDIGADHKQARIGGQPAWQYRFDELYKCQKNFEEVVMNGSVIDWGYKED